MLKPRDDLFSPFPKATYDLDTEIQADRLGLGYLRGASYATRGILRMLNAFGEASKWEGATVPTAGRRFAALLRSGADLKGGEIGRDRYLDRIDGLVYGDDPRAGALHGQTYRCVHCGFAFDLPSGFNVESLRPYLMAISTNVLEGIALIQVNLAPKDYSSTLEKEAVSPTKRTIAGFESTCGALRGGSMDAEFCFFGRGNTTYVLLSLGPTAKSLLTRVLATMRRVSETEINEKPLRIRVRRAKEGGSFEDVARRLCHGSIPVDRLAVLSGFAATDELKPTDRIKCIEP